MSVSHPPNAYECFLDRKAQLDGDHGFTPSWLPDFLFPFQASLVEWAVRKGRAAILADCGLGKTPMSLVWAENIRHATNKPVLILTPLAVAQQFVHEGEKFGIEVARSVRGEITAPIMVANYERLHLFDPIEFGGTVCDESSILKAFEGTTRKVVTDFLRKMPYRLLATATAAPNDYIELGTSSEALGYLGYMDMLSRFFTNDTHNAYGYHGKYRIKEQHFKMRFKGHAEQSFWRWVASWARALRQPSDLGFDDNGFILPPLIYRDHVVKPRRAREGLLFDLPAKSFREEREERRRTIGERCEQVVALVNDTRQLAVVWCHLNPEGDLLAKLIPDAVQVSGADSDDEKEAKFVSFSEGDTRVLITKPVIGAWGLNWQHCAHVITFASHSYEQTYQSIRRCWRFGQTRPVVVDSVVTEGEAEMRANLERKARQAEAMFAALCKHMRDAIGVRRSDIYDQAVEVPTWAVSPSKFSTINTLSTSVIASR